MIKILLRGITDLSFIVEVLRDSAAKHSGKYRIRVNGVIAVYIKNDQYIHLLSAYLVGRENEPIENRIKGLFGLLV